MKKILILSILILSILLLSSSPVFSQDKKEIVFSKGVNDTYQSEAIAYGLFDEISNSFKHSVQESHFIYGTEDLNFKVDFHTASVDINRDGKDEVFVTIIHPSVCGSGGCQTYLLEKKSKKGSNKKLGLTVRNRYSGDVSWEWKKIGQFSLITPTFISSKKNYGYYNIHGTGRWNNYECYYEKSSDKYRCRATEK